MSHGKAMSCRKELQREEKSPVTNHNPSLLHESTLHRASALKILIDLHNKLRVIGGVLISVSHMKKLRLSDLPKVT